MRKYDYVIVGTGPAGLAAAYSLLLKRPELKIMMIDAGKLRKDGLCFMERHVDYLYTHPQKNWNVNFERGCCYAKSCGVCSTIAGFGGCISPDASAKLCFPPSGKWLTRLLGEEKVSALAREVWAFYGRFAGINLPYPSVWGENEAEKIRIRKIVEDAGCTLFDPPVHVAGEKEMSRFLENIYLYLDGRTDIVLNREIDLLKDLDWENHIVRVGKEQIAYGKVILATGRKGHKMSLAFLESIGMLAEGVKTANGTRLILPNEFLAPIGKYFPDFKIKWTQGECKFEVFCFNGDCNGGRLKFMDYGDSVNIDGLLARDYPGNDFFNVLYGNFAVLAESEKDDVPAWQLIEMYGCDKMLARIIAAIARKEEEDVLSEMIYGSDEREKIWGRMKTDNGFWVKPDVAVIGDASGVAMGIVTSMMTGFYIGGL